MNQSTTAFLPGHEQSDDDEITELTSTTGDPSDPVHIQLNRTDDTTFHAEASSTSIQFDGQDATQTVIRDITDQQKAQEHLREIKNFYKQVVDQLPIELAVFSPDGRFEYANSSAIDDPERREWLYGRTNVEYCRERGFDPAIGKRRDDVIREVAKTQQPVSSEETLPSSDSALHYLRVCGPITDLHGNVTHVVGYGLDMTRQKKTEISLRQAKEEAEDASRLKSALLANMSHEIRSPLASIVGFAELLGMRAPDELKELTDPIQSSGTRLLNTLNSVLDLSRIQNQMVDLNPERLDMRVLAKDVIESMQLQANRKDIPLNHDLPAQPVPARLDTGAAQRILINLLDNAIKFSEDGEVRLVLTADEAELVVRVQDHGIGMNPDEVD